MELFHVTFPDRMPGLGLLLLRLLLASMLVYPWALRSAPADPAHLAWAWPVAVLLAGGCLQPVALLLAGVVAAFDPSLQAAPFTGLLLAALLTGPGAYSGDALLFGRRVLLRPASQRRGNDPKE